MVLERALPFAVRTAWRPRLFERVLSVREVGVEALTIAFPWTAYAGRKQEQGYNALELSGVYDCWVKDVEVVNADNALVLGSEWWCRRLRPRGGGGRASSLGGPNPRTPPPPRAPQPPTPSR